MRNYKKLVIGGIQSKVFNLILITVLFLTAAFAGISLYQSSMVGNLAAESSHQLQEAIGQVIGSVMDEVVETNLLRSNQSDAAIADAMFNETAQRVRFLADYAEKLLAHPEDYTPRPYSVPQAENDGTWVTMVVYAPQTDPADPALVSKLGLLSNLSEAMISLCPAFEANGIYIGLPEGAHLTASDNSSGWFADGQRRTFDSRQRGWYQKAAREKRLVFTDGEWDAKSGEYCLECAMPVYGPDGSLEAVVGSDLLLTEMEQVFQELSVEGEYFLLVNQEGEVVLEPQTGAFPIDEADRKGNLRESSNAVLSQIVSDALQGDETSISVTELRDGGYYLCAAPIPSTGWVLVSAFSEAIANQPNVLLQDSNTRIQEESAVTYQEQTRKHLISAIILLVALMLLALASALALGAHIVKPLNTITQRIGQLNEDNLEFKMEDDYRTGDEVEHLAESFAAISHKTLEYMDKVVKVTAEKERLGAELSLATQIQASMLPHIVPAFPDRAEFDILGSMNPAKEVGGDFFDYFLIDDDHLAMLIADVSGKGIPAALFMMASKIILQSVAMLGGSPAEILTRTNEAICSNNDAEMFVTVWLGILEISTGKLTAANAGHEYPALRQPGGQFELYKDRHGFVVGGMGGVRYREYELQLEPGSKLFVYTDGVAEATDAHEELFGTDRMISALNVDPDAAPQEVLKNVRAAVDLFVQDAEQFDDLTMLCLEYKGR